MNTVFVFSFIQFFFILPAKSQEEIDIVQLMTPSEHNEIFGPSTKVPEYEVVPIIHSISSNGTKNRILRFRAFGENVNLNLQSIEEPLLDKNTPIWLAFRGESKKHPVEYNRTQPDTLSDAFKFYEDPNNMAGVSVEEDRNSNLRFMGYIRDALIIKPVPQRVLDEWNKMFHKSRVTRSNRSPSLGDYHIIIKRSLTEEGFFLAQDNAGQIFKRSHGIRKIPQIIYPRILIFTDYNEEYTSERELRFYRLLVYLSAFWYAVDLKFSQFENPKIKFRIMGIIVGMDKTATSYIHDYRLVSKTTIHSDALKAFGKWVIDDSLPIDRDSWDIAVTQTRKKICSEWECKDGRIVGIAYMKGRCTDYNSQSSMTALVHDNFDFSGVSTAAHEIGHIFGATHDNLVPRCTDDGYLMAQFASRGENSYKWSNCSIKSIKDHLSNILNRCYNQTPPPATRDSHISQILPGFFTSPHDQCHSRGWDNACQTSVAICKGLKCYANDIFGTSIFSFCHNTGVPIEGTVCGKNMHCKLGECIENT